MNTYGGGPGVPGAGFGGSNAEVNVDWNLRGSNPTSENVHAGAPDPPDKRDHCGEAISHYLNKNTMRTLKEEGFDQLQARTNIVERCLLCQSTL